MEMEEILAAPAESRVTQRPTPTLSVIVPTRNEAGNVQILARRLANSLSDTGLPWELIFVDDSDDETPLRIGALPRDELQVVMVHRPLGQRHGGLSGAVVEGFREAQGEVLVVMDGDLQHPPEAVPALAVSVVERAGAIAVGSRYVSEANPDGLSGPFRRLVSQATRVLVRMVFPSIWKLQDPLSGLFAMPRTVIEGTTLAPEGFKILLEILVRGHWTDVVEVPYRFAPRESGRSKAGWNEGVHFVRQLIRLRLRSTRRLRTKEYGRTSPSFVRADAIRLSAERRCT